MESQMLTAAAVAGLFTWVCLKWRSIRGDYAVIAYSSAVSLFYLAARQSHKIAAPLSSTTIFFTVYTLTALLCAVLYRLSPFHPLASYPGPWLWWISSMRLSYVSFKGKRHFILDELHRKYGPFVRIGPNTLSINTLSAGSLYSAHSDLEKSGSYNTPGHLPVVAIFFKQRTKQLHADRKRIWSAAFTGASVANFFPLLERSVKTLIECIDNREKASSDGTTDLSECLCHWSYDFMGDMVFAGCNDLELMKRGDPEELVMGGKRATIMLDSAGQSPWLMDIIWYIPLGKSLVRLRDVAAKTMQTRIKADKETSVKDVSSYLLAGDAHTGQKISHKDLEADAAIAIQGGSDNTATTMSLIFFFILAQPKYYKMLQDELDAAFPDPTGSLDNTTLANLPFLNAVINEALRLGTPFFLPRLAPPGGLTLEGRYVPAGTVIALAAYSQQTDPRNFFPAPLDFLPERWLPGGLGPGSITEKAALFSFSSGPHVCVAKAFAHQEMRLVTARLVLAHDMQLAPGVDAAAYRDGIVNMRTTVLQEPLTVRATRRTGFDISRLG